MWYFYNESKVRLYIKFLKTFGIKVSLLLKQTTMQYSHAQKFQTKHNFYANSTLNGLKVIEHDYISIFIAAL